MEKIGLLGGAFDPVHLGHLAVARAVLQELRLDKVWFLPSGCHRFKQQVADFDRRKRWLEQAVAGQPNFVVQDFDKGDGGVCYTADLLEKLPQKNREYFFVVGEDNVAGLSSWHRFDYLLANVRFVVVSRKGAKAWQGLDYADKLEFVQMDFVDVSSSQIRAFPECYADFLSSAIKADVVSFYKQGEN